MDEVEISIKVNADEAMVKFQKLNEELAEMEAHLRAIKEVSDGIFA